MRGGEKVLEAICELYPDATLYTLVQRAGLGLASDRAAPDQDVARPVAAGRRAPLPALPAALSRPPSSCSISTATIS